MDTLRCRILSRTQGYDQLGVWPLEDIVHDLCKRPTGNATLVEVCGPRKRLLFRRSQEYRQVFATWALPVTASISTSLQEALDEFEEWFDQGGKDFMVLCNFEHPETKTSATFLICFKQAEPSTLGSESASSLSFSDSEKLDRRRLPYSASANLRSRSTASRFGLCQGFSLSSVLLIILIALVATFIALTAMFMARHVRDFDPTCPRISKIHASYVPSAEEQMNNLMATSVVTATPTPTTSISHESSQTVSTVAEDDTEWVIPSGNVGPREQKYLLPSNISTFTLTHDIPNDFMLRLDDQALMPIALVDQHERNVQSWFAANFPILASVRDSGDYLASSFLDYNGTNDGPQRLLLNERYHIAHCTTAFRRYLRALSKDRHVCPRDLDLGHLDHCTRQLESFAYRPREVWGSVAEVEQLEDRFMRQDEEFDPLSSTQAMLLWHTDVCY